GRIAPGCRHRRPPRRSGAHEGRRRVCHWCRWQPPPRESAAGAGARPGAAVVARRAGALRIAPALPLSGAVRRAHDVRRPPARPLQRLPRSGPRPCPRVGRPAQGQDALVNSWTGPGYCGSFPGRRDPAQRRIIAMSIVVTAALLVIVCQLWYLQVLEGGRFQEASDKNRIRIRPIAAPRGILFDRNGLPLVDNRPAFTLSLIPRELERDPDKRDATLGRLAVLLQIPFQELVDAVAKGSSDSFLPVRIRRGLSIADMQKVEEWKLELPGGIVEAEPQRVHPNSRFAAHLLGYLREASDEQLKGGRYRRGDMVGQTGLERLLDEFLRGKDGGERIEVDAMGRQIRLIQSTEPHPGAQVVTTVDRRVQEAAERAMEGKAGAVVVMDPRNGDVLAMVSTPAFEID